MAGGPNTPDPRRCSVNGAPSPSLSGSPLRPPQEVGEQLCPAAGRLWKSLCSPAGSTPVSGSPGLWSPLEPNALLRQEGDPAPTTHWLPTRRACPALWPLPEPRPAVPLCASLWLSLFMGKVTLPCCPAAPPRLYVTAATCTLATQPPPHPHPWLGRCPARLGPQGPVSCVRTAHPVLMPQDQGRWFSVAVFQPQPQEPHSSPASSLPLPWAPSLICPFDHPLR